jgi:hypothetical protein
MPRPHFTPGERTPVPIVQEAGWDTQPVWTQRLEEKSSASVGDRTPVVQSVVSHCLSQTTRVYNVCVCGNCDKLLQTKMADFWDVAPCSLIDTDRRFRGAYCLHHQGGRENMKFHLLQIILDVFPGDSNDCTRRQL